MSSTVGSNIRSIAQQIQQNHSETKNQIQSLKQELFAILNQQSPSNTNATNNDQIKVHKWLNKQSLSQYFTNFIANGYDDMDIICDMNQDDLKQIGIDKVGHLKKILKAINNYSDSDDANNKNDNENNNQSHPVQPIDVKSEPSSNDNNWKCVKAIKELVDLCHTLSNPKLNPNKINSKTLELRNLIESESKQTESLPVTVDKSKDDVFTKYIVTEYLRLNPNSPTNPTISWNDKSGRKTKKIIHCQNVLLRKQKMTNYQRVPALNNQFGVIALNDIPNKTIIGEYYGIEYLNDEYTAIQLISGLDGIKQNEYCFEKTVYGKFTKEQIEYFSKIQLRNDNNSNNASSYKPSRKRRKMNENSNNGRVLNMTISKSRPKSLLREDSPDYVIMSPQNGSRKRKRGRPRKEPKEELIDHSFPIFVDGLNHPTPSLMIWMNDCKKDINKQLKTEDDAKYMNVDWVHVWHHGWPKILAVSCKDIKKGDWLFTGYGMSFASLELSKRLFREQLRLNQAKINAVLNENDIDLKM